MAINSKKQEIHWCSPRVGKSNPLKLKRKAIGPDGQVVEMSMANGKAHSRKLGNSYAQLKEYEKPRKGWVWYEECAECGPVVPVGSPSKDLCAGCNEREELIKTRQDAKAERNKDYSKLYETRLDKLTAVLEANMVGAQAPTLSDEQLQAAMAAPAKPKPKKPAK